jgi:transcriptional regulator with XRE-family HTH domain
MSGRPRIESDAELRATEIRQAVAGDIRRILDDSGTRPAALARAASLTPAAISMILRAKREPSFETLARIAIALGGDASVHIYPGAGVAIHDAIQARMVEAFVAELHPRWTAFPEIPVRTPARGSIDLVIADSVDGGLVAAEFHSQLRRAEQVIRWANEKAAALASTELYRFAAVAAGDDGADPGGHPFDGRGAEARRGPAIRRLLVLRSTTATRAVVRSLPGLFAAAYPAPTEAAVGALRQGRNWPGAAIVWMTVHGRKVRVVGVVPRELRQSVGRAGSVGERRLGSSLPER